MSDIMAWVLVVLISFETFPALRAPVQTLPPSVVAAVVALPLIYASGRLSRSKALWALWGFTLWVFLVSLIWLLLDLNLLGDWSSRFVAFLRQGGSLVLGISMFLVARAIAQRVSPRRLVRLMVWGIVPSLILGILGILYIVTGSDQVASLLLKIRHFMVPNGAHDVTRVSGLASEPSHYGLFVGAYALPAVFAAWSTRAFRPRWMVLLLGLLLVTAIYTNSGTGMAVMFLSLLVAALFGPCKGLVLAVCLGAGAALAYFVVSGKAWYLSYHLAMLAQGEPTLSFTTRMFSTFGPLAALREKPWVVVGVGLGGTSAHLEDVVPEAVAQEFRQVSWEGLPTLKTLWGKILAETGVVGAIFFAAFALAAVRSAFFASRLARSAALAHASKSAASALLANLLIHAIGFGTYTFPYLWLWTGLADGFGAVAKREVREGLPTTATKLQHGI